jgi:hypothetical protein
LAPESAERLGSSTGTLCGSQEKTKACVQFADELDKDSRALLLLDFPQRRVYMTPQAGRYTTQCLLSNDSLKSDGNYMYHLL